MCDKLCHRLTDFLDFVLLLCPPEELEKVQEANKEQANQVKYLIKKDECMKKGLAFNVEELKCCADGEMYNAKDKECVAAYGKAKGNPGKSCKDIMDENGPRTDNNRHWIRPNTDKAAVQVLCDWDTDGGGWTMVASNNAADKKLPMGNSRCKIFIEKAGFNDVGRASIDKDFLLGPQFLDLKYAEGRLYSAKERGSDAKAIIDVKIAVTSSTKLLTNNAGNMEAIGDNNRGNIGCGACRHVNLDGQRAEMYDNSCNSGVNDQRTIGFICTNGSPEPSTGTYLGHGANEARDWWGEGSYYPGPRGCTSHDFVIYTTWVR